MDRVSLYEEYRFIEISEAEVNGAWKVAHLLLFFMAFVFGSFCTFFFHMLMYLFDEKCVLFPKFAPSTASRRNVIYESLPDDKESVGMLPLAFLGTQWMENSACHLPTFVPLVSGIFGLIWTTMFLMCSTDTRTHTGLQRPWRVLPPVFVFSLAMGSICVYSSIITHSGLDQLCSKLSEITGSPTCTYMVNVTPPSYERRIRGVHQAVWLTILCAWLHTICWLLSALLIVARVVLAVDFQLVRVSAELIGDIDKMMEHHEKQIRIVRPDVWFSEERSSTSLSKQPTFSGTQQPQTSQQQPRPDHEVDIVYVAPTKKHSSFDSLLPEESNRVARKSAYKKIAKEQKFIVDMVFELLQRLPDSGITPYNSQESSYDDLQEIARKLFIQNDSSFEEAFSPKIVRSQIRIHDEQDPIASTSRNTDTSSIQQNYDPPDAQTSVHSIIEDLGKEVHTKLKHELKEHESISSVSPNMRSQAIGRKKKSNLKTSSTQTDKSIISKKVQITEDNVTEATTSTTYMYGSQEVDKETQSKEKEKRD